MDFSFVNKIHISNKYLKKKMNKLWGILLRTSQDES